MNKSQLATPTKGKISPLKVTIVIAILGLGCTAGVWRFLCKQPKTQKTTGLKEVKYVFFSIDGMPVTLSEQDVYEIKQLYQDGVLPTAIGEKFGMDAVMVSRIINSIKKL